jgi:hypothetical protein
LAIVSYLSKAGYKALSKFGTDFELFQSSSLLHATYFADSTCPIKLLCTA